MDKVAQELRVGVATLERWRAKALGAPRTERTWTATARLEAVMAIAALATPAEVRARPEETRKDQRRIQELEREMRRKDKGKDKALAETAALLVLSKTSRRSSTRARTNDSAEGSPNFRPEYPTSAG